MKEIAEQNRLTEEQVIEYCNKHNLNPYCKDCGKIVAYDNHYFPNYII